jgi:thiamine-phosphate pyrophosphorylase
VSPTRLPDPIGVYAILDAGAMPPADLPAAAAACTSAGVRVFQVRAKDLPAGAFVRLVIAVREVLPPDALLIVNDRADVALASGADGVHVGDEDLAPADVRAILPPGSVVGFSTHSPAEVAAASALPCDYIGFGPVFSSTTKRTGRREHGVEGLAVACAASTRPVVAIGGIEVGQVRALRAAGASGVAMISGLLVPGRVADLARAAVEQAAVGEARCPAR